MTETTGQINLRLAANKFLNDPDIKDFYFKSEVIRGHYDAMTEAVAEIEQETEEGAAA